MDEARLPRLSDPSEPSQGDETGFGEAGFGVTGGRGHTLPQGNRLLEPDGANLARLNGGAQSPVPRPAPLRAVDAAASGSPRPDITPPDLRPFADQLMAIARQLREGEFAAPPPRGYGGGTVSPGASAVIAATDDAQQRRRYGALARKAYAARRRRGAIFGNPDLFGEPAWDILLDLYIADAEGKHVSVSSACIGSAAPPTTGLRWLGVLTEEGLIEREHDPDDQRRVLVHLSKRGLEAMDRYFATIYGPT